MVRTTFSFQAIFGLPVRRLTTAAGATQRHAEKVLGPEVGRIPMQSKTTVIINSSFKK